MTEEQFEQLQQAHLALAKYARLVETTKPRDGVNEPYNKQTQWALILLGELMIMPDDMYAAMCQFVKERYEKIKTEFGQL